MSYAAIKETQIFSITFNRDDGDSGVEYLVPLPYLPLFKQAVIMMARMRSWDKDPPEAIRFMISLLIVVLPC